MTHPIIVFALAIRVCGWGINAGCHYEHVDDYLAEAGCHAAGAIMMLYPRVNGYKCVIETKEYRYRTGVGNPY